MLTEEMPASALVARVLEEAGIEMVFGRHRKFGGICRACADVSG